VVLKLADKIKRIGWTQHFFAQSIEVPALVVSQYCRGHREIPEPVILYISKVLTALNSIEKPLMSDIGALTEEGRQYSAAFRESKKL
jgi:transcriptional regulator with XRE-family HTH domain